MSVIIIIVLVGIIIGLCFYFKTKEKTQKIKLKYNQSIESLQELKKHTEQEYQEISQKLIQTRESIVEAHKIALAAIEANQRAEKNKYQQDFYRLVISQDSIKEIQQLQECAKYLKNPEPLNKVIWSTYYQNPYNDLIHRVLKDINPNEQSGIYKITNLKNGKCYVGQTVNFSDRWKTHIKQGLGAEKHSNNKLYLAMAQEGVENFSFEVIELINRHDKKTMSARETFWQDYFKAKDFGYSIR